MQYAPLHLDEQPFSIQERSWDAFVSQMLPSGKAMPTHDARQTRSSRPHPELHRTPLLNADFNGWWMLPPHPTGFDQKMKSDYMLPAFYSLSSTASKIFASVRAPRLSTISSPTVIAV